MRIFISYARIQRNKVEELESILTRAGHDAWFDREIDAGEKWWKVICESIESCEVFVFALSPESANSDACRAEFQYALDLNKPILPVQLSKAELPIGELQERQFVDARNLKSSETILEMNRALNRLGDRIRAGEFPAPSPLPPKPAFPFPPDPLVDMRQKVEQIRQLPEEEIVRLIYNIQLISRSSGKTSQEARDLLRKIAENSSLPYGVVELARATLASIPTPASLSNIWPQLVMLALVVVIGVGALLLFRSVPSANSTTNTPDEGTSAAVVVTESPIESNARPEATSEPTEESSPTDTDTPTKTPSPTRTPTTTTTPTRTSSPTRTPSPTLTPTSTLTRTLSARDRLLLTQTAQAMTPSPVPRDPSSLETYPPITMENVEQVGEILTLPPAHTSTIRALAFSPDGSLLASASSDFTARVWDVESQRAIQRIAESQDWVTDVVFSPDGETLALVTQDGFARIWGGFLPHLNRIQRYIIERETPIWAVAFSSDSNILALGLNNGTVELWDIPTQTTLLTIDAHESAVRSLAISPDDTRIVTGGADGTIRLWDLQTGEKLRDLSGHQAQVNALEFSADGNIIFTGSADGAVRALDANSTDRINTFAGAEVWDISFDDQSGIVAIASDDGRVYLWDYVNDVELAALEGHTGPVRSVAFSPDGHLIASGGEEGDNTIRIWGVVGS